MNAGDLFNPDETIPYTQNGIHHRENKAGILYNQLNDRFKNYHPFSEREKNIINDIQNYYGGLDNIYRQTQNFVKNKYAPKYHELQNQIANIKTLAEQLKNEKMLFESNPVVASQLRTERYNASEAAKARVWQQTMYGRRFQDAINDIKKAGLNPYILNNFSPAGGFTGGAAQIMSNVQHHFSNIKSTNYNRNKTTSKNWNYNKNERVWNPMDIAQAILSGFAGIIGGAGSLIGGIGKIH